MNITKKEYDKEYYLRNKEHRLQQAQEWRSRNKEKLKIWQHEYYLKKQKTKFRNRARTASGVQWDPKANLVGGKPLIFETRLAPMRKEIK